jgi:UDPglucose 6-dehydrogenase
MKIKEICCIGAGYVGGPTMAAIAFKCPDIKVNVVDINENKIKLWNSDNLDDIPIKEPGLNEIINQVRGKNLFFSTDVDSSIQKSQIIFLAVNTPTATSGPGKGKAADLKYIIKSAENIAKVAKGKKIIVEKSTLPVRTAEKLKEIIAKNSSDFDFEVLSNPEFLAEGTAINDLFKSDRVLIGGDKTDSGIKAVNILSKIYERWIPKEKIIKTNIWSSELSKLVSNAMLAQRISSINSLSALCEKTGADIEEISKVVGADIRIGPHFLKASVGFGGSCFQKDILNLVYICELYNLPEVANFWEEVIKINNFQKNRFSKKLITAFKKQNKYNTISILGWSFKKDTNDSRESASIYITENILNENINVNVYDPMIKKSQILNDIKNIFEQKGINKKEITQKIKKINVFDSPYTALEESNIIAIITEWDDFKKLDWKKISNNIDGEIYLFDGRNILADLNLKSEKIKYFKL